MNKLYIIGAQYIKDNSELYDNVEEKFISRTILSSQDIDLQNLLGTELYTIVLSELYQYKLTGTTISTRIKTLVDEYLVPMLLYSVLRDVVPFMVFKMTPAAVGINDNNVSNNSTTYQTVALFRKEYDTKYQHYLSRASNYLTVNDTLYPEWALLDSNGNVQNMAPSKNINYFGGIQL